MELAGPGQVGLAAQGGHQRSSTRPTRTRKQRRRYIGVEGIPKIESLEEVP